ncbi:MAG: hypothetical protein AB7K14_14615 [Lysobacterales bacterium]
MTSSLSRIYVAAGGWKVFLLICGGACFVGGLAGIGYFRRESIPAAALLLQGISLALAVLGLTCVAYVVRYRVVLQPHSIKVREMFKERSLHRNDIAARRTLQVPNSPPIIEFIPKDKSTRPLRISQFIRTDDSFRSWLDGIPDQDELDQQRFQEEIVANRLLGDTKQERLLQMDRLHRWTRHLGIGTSAVVVWGLLYPRPYEIVVGALIVLPAVALVFAATSKGLIQVNQHLRDKRPSIVNTLIGSGALLALRAFLDFHVLDWPLVLGAALAVAALITLVITRLDVAMRNWSAALLMGCVFCLPYAYGTVVELNVLLDGAAPQRLATTVTGKHQTTGNYQSWNLIIAAWDSAHDSVDVNVNKRMYESVAVGDTVCVILFRGALGLNWISVQSCP